MQAGQPGCGCNFFVDLLAVISAVVLPPTMALGKRSLAQFRAMVRNDDGVGFFELDLVCNTSNVRDRSGF